MLTVRFKASTPHWLIIAVLLLPIPTFAPLAGIFATVHGNLILDNDREAIDRLWNRYVAAWYEGGKDDPNLALLRLNADRAEIWLDASSVVAGIKLLFGADPKEEYKDNVAKVRLGA